MILACANGNNGELDRLDNNSVSDLQKDDRKWSPEPDELLDSVSATSSEKEIRYLFKICQQFLNDILYDVIMLVSVILLYGLFNIVFNILL